MWYNNVMSQEETSFAERLGNILGTICYWFIIFAAAAFIVMSAWNTVVGPMFQLNEIKFFESMLLMLGVRSMALCFCHNK